MEKYNYYSKLSKITGVFMYVGTLAALIYYIYINFTPVLSKENKDNTVIAIEIGVGGLIVFFCTFAILVKIHSIVLERFNLLAYEGYAEPMIKKEFNIIESERGQRISDSSLNMLFSKINKRDGGGKNEEIRWDTVYGNIYIKGVYRQLKWECSNIQLERHLQRGSITVFLGIVFVLEHEKGKRFNPEFFMEKMCWKNPFEQKLFAHNRGLITINEYDDKVYIGFDFGRAFFEGKKTFEWFKKQCKNDLNFLRKMLYFASEAIS